MNFLNKLAGNTLLFDGAMGTELQKHEPIIDDYPNKQAGFTDGLILTHPEWIKAIHESYIEAGADVIETNTFGSNYIKLREYNMEDRMDEINRKAVETAVSAIDDAGKEKYVAGSMGPTGLTPSIECDDQMLNDIENAYESQATSLENAGADLLLLETCQDLLEIKSAIIGAKRGSKLQIMASITLALNNSMLFGSTVGAAYSSISSMGIDIFGINCSTGPVEMETSLEWLDLNSTHPVSLIPNAGLPINGVDGVMFPLKADEMGEIMEGFLNKYEKLKIIGGCCGTNPTHIKNLRKIINKRF